MVSSSSSQHVETQARPEQDGAGDSQIVHPMIVVCTSLTLPPSPLYRGTERWLSAA